MANELAVVAERLCDDLEAFRKQLRAKYPAKSSQVQSATLKRDAAALSEKWLVDLMGSEDFATAIGEDLAADLNVDFQRILVASRRSAQRATYEAALGAILKEFVPRVIIPLKQRGARRNSGPAFTQRPGNTPTSIFFGHSFAEADRIIVDCVRQTFDVLRIPVVTGERPQADRISEKVKRLIDAQPVFVGLYTRRAKLEGRKRWTASPWVIEEKAFAVAKRKTLILLQERGIDSIGGMQGDYEYIPFSRDTLHEIVLGVLRLFAVSVHGFASEGEQGLLSGQGGKDRNPFGTSAQGIFG